MTKIKWNGSKLHSFTEEDISDEEALSIGEDNKHLKIIHQSYHVTHQNRVAVDLLCLSKVMMTLKIKNLA